MKNLIFILLFAFQGVCGAQDIQFIDACGLPPFSPVDWFIYKSHPDSVAEFRYNGNVALSNGIPSVKLDIPIKYDFIQLMFEYEEECLKDSVFVGCTIEMLTDTLPDNLGGYVILGERKVVDVYKPKDPTFSGFLQWLHKKLIK